MRAELAEREFRVGCQGEQVWCPVGVGVDRRMMRVFRLGLDAFELPASGLRQGLAPLGDHASDFLGRHAAADARRTAGGTRAGAAGALLAIQLGGRRLHFGPGLGVVGPLALVGQVVAHGLGQQPHVAVGVDAERAVDETVTDVEPAVRRFVAEAQLTSQLQHPNIVPVYELAKTEVDERLVPLIPDESRELYVGVTEQGAMTLLQGGCTELSAVAALREFAGW